MSNQDTGDVDNFSSQMVSDLNKMVHPIPRNPLDTSDSELSKFAHVGNASFVGLGEATHGTREFFQMKFRIFKYLVENHGFRIFGFESDFAESIFIDRYITTGEGDLRTIMHEKMHFWCWRTEEVYELLEWMRHYNASRARTDMVRFVGFDCQFLSYQSGLILQYLDKVSPEYRSHVKKTFEYISDISIRTLMDMESDLFDELLSEVETCFQYFSSHRSSFIEISGREHYIIHMQLIRTIAQTLELRYRYQGDNRGLYSTARDAFMAENALWIPNLINDERNVKVVLWAHNGHVANSSRFPSMGNLLKRQLDYNYRIVGFTFYSGRFYAQNGDSDQRELEIQSFNQPVNKNSVNYFFHMAERKNFIFNFDQLDSRTDLFKYFQKWRPLISIGLYFPWGSSYDHLFGSMYDVLIHYDETDAARQLAE